MADRDASLSGRLVRLRGRLDGWLSSDEDGDRQRWVQFLQVVSTAVVIASLDVVWSGLAALPSVAGGVARESATALAALLPWLVGLTVLAVAACVAVVWLSLREL